MNMCSLHQLHYLIMTVGTMVVSMSEFSSVHYGCTQMPSNLPRSWIRPARLHGKESARIRIRIIRVYH